MKYKCLFIIIILSILVNTKINAQQNHTMYLQHYLPESNLLNPAVPLECKWYVGIPILSSTHINLANSGFSYNQIFQTTGAESYSENIDNVVNRLRRRSFAGTELHTQWFALGYRHKNYSFYFTLTEKNNFPLTYPKSFIQLLWKGNTMFEGETVGLNGLGSYFNHYREYAFTVSKYERSAIFYGVRAKVLFGKLNLSSRSANLNMMTDETTFNLDFEGDINVNASLPLTVEERGNLVGEIQWDDNFDLMQLIFNRKNPGFAIDAGVIYPLNSDLEISASILDLGLIHWGSNLNNFVGEGNFSYEGELEQTDQIDTYVEGIMESIIDSFQIEISKKKYTSFLPPRLLAGAKYNINEYFNIGANGEIVVYRTKILPSLTFSGHYQPLEHIHFMASYSLQYSSYNNLGIGFAWGRNPIQFYAITDNINGIFWPLNARNINLRFGLNIIFGCNIKNIRNSLPGSLRGNCSCYDDPVKPKRRR